MEQTRVLVTGGCGFLGTAIVSALLSTHRFAITALDINPPSPDNPSFPQQVSYIRANVLDLSALQKAFDSARPEIVIHTVGVYPLGAKRYSMKGKEIVYEVNVEGTRNVLDAAKGCGARGLVYTSSVTVVMDEMDRDFRNVDERWPTGRAHTSYGLSKALAESLVLTSSTPAFPTCSLRIAPIFGPRDLTVIPTIHALLAAHTTPFILGRGTNLQDYIYISNAADAHVLAATNLLSSSQTAAGEAFFITNGEPLGVRDLCLAVWREFGHVPKWEVRVPEGLAWWMGWGAEWVDWVVGRKGEGEFCRGVVSDGCRERYVSIEKARRVLGYEPRVGLEEGLRISCQDYQRRIDERSKR